MATSVKVCNFSCSCVREDCSFKHRIDDIELRKEFKKVIDAKFDKNEHNETDPEGIRHIPCIHGFLCGKEDCGYKHRCSFAGRKEIQNEWYISHPRIQRKQLTEEDAEQMRKLVAKYMMSYEDGELINLFSRLLRRSKE
jgi:hypothetical protein